MYQMKVSVRTLVEFILRSGDITSSESGLADPDAMQEGTRIHKKLQRLMGSSYQAEVPLSATIPLTGDGIEMEIIVEGRADGIFPEPDESGMTIDEIKGVYRPLFQIKEPVAVHRAQALCYAYIYANQNQLPDMGVRMTYCHIPTEKTKYFPERLSIQELETWFFQLLDEYGKWMAWQIQWQEARNLSIKALSFPFAYREGQFSLVKGVYQSILRKKRLYIEAPTGVGKTLSTVFPSIKSMGEELAEKIFYLTAKTITHTVAEQAFHILTDNGLKLKSITLTAKEKLCILDKPQCSPMTCPRAQGHFDRVNDAVFDLLTSEDLITREHVLDYAAKHNVCPFEMSLDVSIWCDAIIGDYNYAFDPTACLKRFFAQETENNFIFLIDEAHNLVSRAREMYSAVLIKEEFLSARKTASPHYKKLVRNLSSCNREMLQLKRECDDVCIFEPVQIEPLVIKLMRLITALEELLLSHSTETTHQTEDTAPPLDGEQREQLLDLYFSVRSFTNIFETLDDKYKIYANYNAAGDFLLHLQCMDPSSNLDSYLRRGRSAIFFSATLLPITYYRGQLAGREDDYAIYAPSPFPSDHRLLMIGRGVSTKYTRRGPSEYRKIVDYILHFILARKGNYLIFFPSYRMMEEIAEYMAEAMTDIEECIDLYIQSPSMTEIEREEYLSHFQDIPACTTVGFCVMGGIFGEGIDLKDSRLIGAVIVGTGLPMVCTENELFRDYFDQEKGTGFDYAYQYPGMNKVLQAAGRVIRTATDYGAILLLDERFLQPAYQKLFPREWYPYEIVTSDTMGTYLSRFWDNVP